MNSFDADLHIHSPYSIAVSKNLNLDTMVNTCKKKGLNILGTGDITQPDWRKYLETNLKFQNGIYSYKDVNFIPQTELEDDNSIHHVIFLPDIKTGKILQTQIENKTKDVPGRWAGRPHVHLSTAEIAELVDGLGGISGPAHAFTPFKAIFRQGKFTSLEDAYGYALKKIHFIELGLSADTNIADRLKCLENVSFLSNSDAHSEGIQSLGREFNRFDIEKPSFEEILDGIQNRDGRSISLNVGLEPRLGKYPMMFCKKCRKRVQLLYDDHNSLEITKLRQLKRKSTLTFEYSITETFIYYFFKDREEMADLKRDIGKKLINCPYCLSQKKPSKSKILLGVFDRIDEIADFEKPIHPPHRPPYIDIVPLAEMLRIIKGVKSVNAQSVKKEYEVIVNRFGPEFKILTDESLTDEIEKSGHIKLSALIKAFRGNEIEFIPGGGGRYGEISIDEI